jgi:hypothetical protein
MSEKTLAKQDERKSVFTIGCASKFPGASTAPTLVLRLHKPDVVLEGGTLAEGTNILHCHLPVILSSQLNFAENDLIKIIP